MREWRLVHGLESVLKNKDRIKDLVFKFRILIWTWIGESHIYDMKLCKLDDTGIFPPILFTSMCIYSYIIIVFVIVIVMHSTYVQYIQAQVQVTYLPIYSYLLSIYTIHISL